jgi:MFS family permease
MDQKEPEARAGSGGVLALLAASQFLMTLDSSVMNVSLATVADDLGTPITGVQTAITCYTLVMASLMITGGKLGAMFGRRRMLGLGLTVYGAGSLTTAIAPNLAVLLFGWSLLEGIGAALIMPAIVALVATNFPEERRAAAYGVIAAAGAGAVAVGPLIGGAVTTLASWRYVFVAEVLLVVLILGRLRRIEDAPGVPGRLDTVGALLSVASLGTLVFGVLRSSEWGWITPRPDGPEILGASPVVWLLAGGVLLVFAFFRWEDRVERSGREPLLRAGMFANRQLSGGLLVFLTQFLVQAGVFFALPLFLSVVLELDALATGIRVFPLSVTLLVTALALPRLAPRANPRLVVRAGLAAMAAGIFLLVAGMDPGAGAGVVAVPMLVIGVGLGLLASQLGAVTVSAVPESQSAEVGGLQNTATNLGASLGTALIGSVLIASLSSSVVEGLRNDPEVPDSVFAAAETDLAGGVPFLSDSQLRDALRDAGLDPSAVDAIVEVNADARLDALRSAFGLAGILAVGGLLLTARIPDRAPGSRREGAEDAGAGAASA